MTISRSQTSFEDRVASNQEVAAAKKHKKRLEQKKKYYHMDKEKKRLAEEQKAQQEKDQAFKQSGLSREREYLCLPGEYTPNKDAVNISEALIVANRFCAALGLLLVEETILQRELRVLTEWQPNHFPRGQLLQLQAPGSPDLTRFRFYLGHYCFPLLADCSTGSGPGINHWLSGLNFYRNYG